MKVFVTAITGGADAREYEEGITILAVHKDWEDASEFFHGLVDEEIRDSGMFNEGIEDERGVWSHEAKDGSGSYVSYWQLGRELRMINDYNCKFLQTSEEDLK